MVFWKVLRKTSTQYRVCPDQWRICL